jgi:hypothetical protein
LLFRERQRISQLEHRKRKRAARIIMINPPDFFHFFISPIIRTGQSSPSLQKNRSASSVNQSKRIAEDYVISFGIEAEARWSGVRKKSKTIASPNPLFLHPRSD